MTTTTLIRPVEAAEPDVTADDRITTHEWAVALRSGTYVQCTARLRDGDTFCAMGVLADLAVRRGRAEWCTSGPLRALVWHTTSGRRETWPSSLPLALLHELDIDYTVQQTITALNDAGVPFDVLATFIETVHTDGLVAATDALRDQVFLDPALRVMIERFHMLARLQARAS